MQFLRFTFLVGLLTIFSAFGRDKGAFEEKQKGFERVRMAYDRKEEYVKMRCRNLDIPESFGNIYIRAFKKEGILEVWVQKPDGKYVMFNEYKIYAHSGRLGPKRQEGDAQVPEGYYYINDFNPASNYHLSLGINYPNDSDKRLSRAQNKGGDIYIHGGSSSVGCLAMSDYYIENIYICAVKARNSGQEKIPVHIFPFKPTPINIEYYSNFKDYKQYKPLWRNFAECYMYFEKTHHLPEVMVADDGSYKVLGPPLVEDK